MIDPSIDLAKVLRGTESALWAQSIEVDHFWNEERKAKKKIVLGLVAILLIGPLLVFRAYVDLRVKAFSSGVDLYDAVFMVALFSAVLYLSQLTYVAVTFKPNLARVPLIYVITDRRLISLNKDYGRVDEMRLADMEFLIESMPHNTILVSRRDDPDSENNFYIELAGELSAARKIIQTLLEESAPK